MVTVKTRSIDRRADHPVCTPAKGPGGTSLPLLLRQGAVLAGADPKVVQRILGHASAAMTMDLYGHLIDNNLWDSAKRVGGILGAPDPSDAIDSTDEADESGSDLG